MTDFDDDERSASRSRPIDLYTIASPAVTYRLTSHPVDVTFDGRVYKAITMSRGPQAVAQELTGHELVIYLPITHPFVQRYAAQGVPDQRVVVTLQRLQEVSGIAIQSHVGFGQSMSIDGHVAMLRVPALTEDAMQIRLPVIAAQRICNHVLYDAQCTVDRVAAVAGSPFAITSITGNRLATTSGATGTQYQYGEIVHLRTGQRRSILLQEGDVTLTLDQAFVDAVVGDQVEIAPGCDHQVITCRDKYSNVINFGGHPLMNAFNPWLPKGLGVVQQA